MVSILLIFTINSRAVSKLTLASTTTSIPVYDRAGQGFPISFDRGPPERPQPLENRFSRAKYPLYLGFLWFIKGHLAGFGGPEQLFDSPSTNNITFLLFGVWIRQRSGFLDLFSVIHAHVRQED